MFKINFVGQKLYRIKNVQFAYPKNEKSRVYILTAFLYSIGKIYVMSDSEIPNNKKT